MPTSRIEAFSDGVIAIIVTIMVLTFNIPHDASLRALLVMTPRFLSYVLSFVVVAIMWVNHHHLIRSAKRADASLMWANNFLLFWMSLIPFATGYMGENHAAPLAVAVYGAVLTFCAAAFAVLRWDIAGQHARNSELNEHHTRMVRKDLLGVAMYASSIPLAYVTVYAAFFIFVLIPGLYFLPDRKLMQ